MHTETHPPTHTHTHTDMRVITQMHLSKLIPHWLTEKVIQKKMT